MPLHTAAGGAAATAATGAHDRGGRGRFGIRLLEAPIGRRKDPRGGEPASDFQITSLTPARGTDGRPEILAQVRNSGGRALEMAGALTLTDGPGKMNAGPFPATLGTTLLPGDSAPVSVVLDGRLPDGPWTARPTLESGMIKHAVRPRSAFRPARAREARRYG